MDTPASSMRDLARRLLAASQSASGPHVHEAVIERLRISLTRFAGADGFASLLRRALALAKSETSSVESIAIGADNRLQGFEQLNPGTGNESALAITAHLLALLVTFVGEPLTLRLVRQAWPEMPLDESIYERR